MLETDNEQAARVSSGLLDDPRVIHFYDPEKRFGKAIAEGLHGEGKTAWDIYLFYKPGVQWVETPPQPVSWMHQLYPSSWADPNYYRTGQDLVEELRKSVEQQCYNRACLHPNA